MTRQDPRSPGWPSVGIIVLNWNGWRDTLPCIESLDRLDYPNRSVIVVDNGSTDDSVARIRAGCPGVRVLETGANLGFAGGYNFGIRHGVDAGFDYLWILNNDTVVAPDSLRALVAMARASPDHVFFGSWIAYFDEPDRLWFGGGTYRWKTGHIGHRHFDAALSSCPASDRPVETDWITGCSMLIPANAVSSIGLMDESFFLFREDVEWQLRRNPRRPRGLILTRPLVLHKLGRSTGSARSHLGTVFMARNYLKLARRYAGVAAPAWLIRWLTTFLLTPLAKGDLRTCRAAIRSIALLDAPGARILAELTRTSEAGALRGD